jgi:ABC-type transporter Mla subunit MlaD
MTDFQTQQRRRNMVVGGFVLLAFLAFVWMMVKFRNLPLFASQLRSFTVLVQFPDAPGVQKDTPVQYCGYQIGRVINVAPPRLVTDEAGQKRHRVGVSIAIDKQYVDIPDHVDIQIVKRGLGSSYIEFVVNPNEPIAGYLVDEMVLAGQVSSASEFFPPQVQQKLENLVESITLLSQNTNAIIGDADNQENIKKTLENVVAATAQATDTLKSVQHLTDVGAERIEEVAFNLDAAMKEFRLLLVKIHDGQGSAGRFINDGRLYENLLDSSRELELALEQLKQWAAEARDKGIRIKW